VAAYERARDAFASLTPELQAAMPEAAVAVELLRERAEQAQAKAEASAVAEAREKALKAMGLTPELLDEAKSKTAKPSASTPEGRLAALQVADGRLAMAFPSESWGKEKLSGKDLNLAVEIVAGHMPATADNATFHLECKQACGRQCSPLMSRALGIKGLAAVRQYASRNAGKGKPDKPKASAKASDVIVRRK